MGRNDGVLYTGSSSASFAKKVQPVVKAISEEKSLKHSKLINDGAGEIILEILDKEIKRLKTLDFEAIKALIASDIKNGVEIDMLSRATAGEILESAKIQIKNIMRDIKNVK